jgi:DNA recombination protein RmuC
METVEILLIVLAAIIGAAALWSIVQSAQTRREQQATARQLAETVAAVSSGQSGLTERLAQLSEANTAAQSSLADRLHQQEMKLTQELNARLDTIQQRMGTSLQESTRQTLETMGKVEKRLAVIDEAQKRMEHLGNDMATLNQILSNKQSRGAYGEIQLNDIVSDIMAPDDYAFQAPLGNGRQVDCLLMLPNPPGSIGVDSKFPLDGYQRLRAAETREDRDRAARQFRQDVLKHIRDIAERYIVLGETADQAIMFIPSEAVYAEIHASFGDVVSESFRLRVFLASPTTLMALLNTIRSVLKDARMREQAGLIQQELMKMMKDVDRLGERVDKLQRNFETAYNTVREVRTSTDKISSKVGRIAELEWEAADFDDDDVVVAPRLVGNLDRE